ncbi:MAG: T9SS type A sorting domain-containing protein [Bacteroidota bacterium]
MNKGFSLCFLFVFSLDALAQVELVPIRKDKFEVTSLNTRTERLAQDTLILPLPFFDDFSLADEVPDTLRWLNSDNVGISSGLGINPPSINVAVLDGVDQSGQPYNFSSDIAQVVDVLTSQFIDLSSFTVSSNIFLSFFWQLEGRGETPDQDDELRIQFKDQDGQWITQGTISGDAEQDPDFFNFIDFGLTAQSDSIFFHESFQFRLQAFGDPSGIFDFWLVDYFRMNTGRSPGDRSFEDEAFVTNPTSILGSLTAIPLDHFIEAELSLDTIPEADVVTLNEDRFAGGISVFGININTFLRDTETDFIIDSLSFTDPIDSTIVIGDPVREFSETFQVVTFNEATATEDQLLNYFQANPDRDSIVIETSMSFISDFDSSAVFEETNANSSVSSLVNFTNFYAYDDGEAEQGFGIRQRDGQVAVRYIIEKEDLLNQFDVYFPPTNADPGPIRFFIRTELNDDNSGLIYIDQIERRPDQFLAVELNQFRSIQLERGVTVGDTIFIGYQQSSSEERVFVGYDRNTDTRNAIFQNISGSWIPLDPSTEPGSIMIRPKFVDTDEVITSIGKIEQQNLVVYPNPSKGIFNIEGQFDFYELYNLSGIKVLEGNQAQMDIGTFRSGLYILRLSIDGDIITKKIVLNHD